VFSDKPWGLTYANVTATLALFLAIGGSAYAAATTLPANSVSTTQLQDGAVTTLKLHDHAVTGAKVARQSLTGANIQSSTLGTVPAASNASSLGGTSASEYLHDFQVIETQGPMNSETDKTQITSCPSDSFVVAGGAELYTNNTGDDQKVAVNVSAPTDDHTGWFVRAIAVNGGPAGTWRVGSWATCAVNAPQH
jgi:hypothetical protein